MPLPARTDDVAELPDLAAEHMPVEEGRAERAWFCVDALTCSLTARWVRKALISGSAMSATSAVGSSPLISWMSGMRSPQETSEPRLDQLAFGCCSSFSAIQTLMID